MQKFLIIIFILISILITSVSLADQCPDFTTVWVNNQWQIPEDWDNLPLSPLAKVTTGSVVIPSSGLYQVRYLSDQNEIRCIYIKAGEGVMDHLYILTKSLNQFSPIGDNWSHYACHAYKKSSTLKHPKILNPEQCQWE